MTILKTRFLSSRHFGVNCNAFCLVALLLGTGTVVRAAEKDVRAADKPVDPKQAAADAAASITRGIDYLVTSQNKSGSWGDQSLRGGVPIYSSIPGGFDSFQVATTALCIMALEEAGDTRPEAVEARERAEAWLVKKLPQVRRSTEHLLVNIWGHAYGIRARVRMHNGLKADDPQRAELIKLIEQQVDLLDRYATVNGGWCYYESDFATRNPNGDPPSFSTATVLIALYEAKQLGVELPQRTVDKAVKCLNLQRMPGFTYTYSLQHTRAPGNPINRLPGSLGRSQVCNLALRLFGNEQITIEVLDSWLEKLLKHNFWLSVGRKTLNPHESYAQVAGYFFYYGHFYAACCLEQLPEADRSKYAPRLAALIVSLQDKDGSWFDYPLYNYHKPYGTAYALMTLLRCK